MNITQRNEIENQKYHNKIEWSIQYRGQKSASVVKTASSEQLPFIAIPAFWYSPTFFSKKLVFPSREMFSMKSKGLVVLYTLSQSSSTRSLSATNLIYCTIRSAFIPMRRQGRASVRNSHSMLTASLTIS